MTPSRVLQSSLVHEIARGCRYFDPARPEHALSTHGECIGDKDIREAYNEMVRFPV
jgi:hypothetical protein